MGQGVAKLTEQIVTPILAELGLGAAFDLNRNRKNDDLFGLFLVSPKDSVGLAESKVYISLDPIGTLAKNNMIMLNERLELGKAVPCWMPIPSCCTF